LHPSVRYEGVAPHEEIHKILGNYDVLVFPSHFIGEGHPGVIVEAMSCGLPIIATKWRSIPELVKDGENGMLIEPQNSEALRSAMKQFILNRQLLRNMGCRSLEEAEKYAGKKIIACFMARLNILVN
jgi:glycosyltransferase involved in cell wall biosynthesis